MRVSGLACVVALLISQQVGCCAAETCKCELTGVGEQFPHNKLRTAEQDAIKCNQNVTPQKIKELDTLLLGLNYRLPQLEQDIAQLEREDDGDLFGSISLQVIENELAEILHLITKLNSTTHRHQQLNMDTAQEIQDLREEMEDLEAYDKMQVVKRQQANLRLRRDLEQCKNGQHPTAQPTPSHGNCPHGQLFNVTGPIVFTAGEYPGSYKYGAWGRDPRPEAGKESWYWLVMLTSSNIYAHYVRRYSSLSALIVGVSVPGNTMISPSNPTTNTIQGPNVVMYGEALYYGCYNRDAVCHFNLTTKSVTSVELPKGTRFNNKGNFCTLEACYPYTDLDLATDESGVWVVYSTAQSFGNLVLTKVEPGSPPTLGRTWTSSLYKQAVSNTFVACGVLYATRFVNKDTEEIFYSFDTMTGIERFDLRIHFHKMAANVYSLNYSPVDKMLHAYIESNMLSYNVVFG